MPTTRRIVTLPILRRLAATASVMALLGSVLGVISPAAQAASTGSHAATVWAVTASGAKVAITKPVFTPTPIHPERIAHPQADSMGTVTATYAPWSATATITPYVTQLPGIDVSSWQGNIDWASVAPYIDFSYAKATEGTYYTNPYFYNQYEGPYDYGVIRGAYHFAIPSNSSGQTQADYFIAHGGGWSSDGLTLPGALDIEYNPYGSECYGLTWSQMVNWVWNFVNEYAYREGVYPVIYTTTDWWSTCTGNYGGFGAYAPLWIANYSASNGGPLPNGWSYYTFWPPPDLPPIPNV